MSQHIEYLGHAGFLIEHQDMALVMDPWVNPQGAYDQSWFQFPCNHHYFRELPERLAGKTTYVYLSHGHHDHFDPEFLGMLAKRTAIRFLIPSFTSKGFREMVSAIPHHSLTELKDGERWSEPTGHWQGACFVDDSGLCRDSAFLLQIGGTFSFLNLNDCKIYDRLGEMRQICPNMDLFTTQFSGATWHPVCYDYPPDARRKISEAKRMSKFRQVGNSLRNLRPTLYVNSAGPACFLDDELIELNFEALSTFPDAWEFSDFLNATLPSQRQEVIQPGDRIGIPDLTLHPVAGRLDRKDKRAYILDYAGRHRAGIAAMHAGNGLLDKPALLDRLAGELREKVRGFSVPTEPFPAAIFVVDGGPDGAVVDFAARSVQIGPARQQREVFYQFDIPAWAADRLLRKKINWEELSLSFRVKAHRQPDTYCTGVNGFFFNEADQMADFCRKLTDFRANRERIVVTSEGSSHEIDGKCPHQGGDLKAGWSDGPCWVCPRHRWKFDLTNGGKCTTSADSIHSVRCLSMEAES
jgi:UDP-MurNAc hydroxylase